LELFRQTNKADKPEEENTEEVTNLLLNTLKEQAMFSNLNKTEMEQFSEISAIIVFCVETHFLRKTLY
jgi:hypothetical protein